MKSTNAIQHHNKRELPEPSNPLTSSAGEERSEEWNDRLEIIPGRNLEELGLSWCFGVGGSRVHCLRHDALHACMHAHLHTQAVFEAYLKYSQSCCRGLPCTMYIWELVKTEVPYAPQGYIELFGETLSDTCVWDASIYKPMLFGVLLRRRRKLNSAQLRLGASSKTR